MTSNETPGERHARIRLFIMLGLAALAGTGTLLLLESNRIWLEAWLLDNADLLLEYPIRSALLLLIPGLPVLLASVSLWRLGQRCCREKRFPPSDTLMLRQRAEVNGRAAILRGRMLQSMALLMGLACFGLPLMLALSLYRIAGGG